MESKEGPHFKGQRDKLFDSLSRARVAQGKLLSKVRSLGLVLGKEQRTEILIEETIKTAAIEGCFFN